MHSKYATQFKYARKMHGTRSTYKKKKIGTMGRNSQSVASLSWIMIFCLQERVHVERTKNKQS